MLSADKDGLRVSCGEGSVLIKNIKIEGKKKMTVSEGSVYPMLKRLQTDGYFETYLKESPNGPARKYYRITISGKQRQAMLLKQWTEFTDQVNSFFEGVSI